MQRSVSFFSAHSQKPSTSNPQDEKKSDSSNLQKIKRVTLDMSSALGGGYIKQWLPTSVTSASFSLDALAKRLTDLGDQTKKEIAKIPATQTRLIETVNALQSEMASLSRSFARRDIKAILKSYVLLQTLSNYFPGASAQTVPPYVYEDGQAPGGSNLCSNIGWLDYCYQGYLFNNATQTVAAGVSVAFKTASGLSSDYTSKQVLRNCLKVTDVANLALQALQYDATSNPNAPTALCTSDGPRVFYNTTTTGWVANLGVNGCNYFANAFKGAADECMSETDYYTQSAMNLGIILGVVVGVLAVGLLGVGAYAYGCQFIEWVKDNCFSRPEPRWNDELPFRRNFHRDAFVQPPQASPRSIQMVPNPFENAGPEGSLTVTVLREGENPLEAADEKNERLPNAEDEANPFLAMPFADIDIEQGAKAGDDVQLESNPFDEQEGVPHHEHAPGGPAETPKGPRV